MRSVSAVSASQLWEHMFAKGIDAQAAADRCGCSLKTARAQLVAAGRRVRKARRARSVAFAASRLVISAGEPGSNWPRIFVHMAIRIEREGSAAVSDAERDAILMGLPSGISVKK